MNNALKKANSILRKERDKNPVAFYLLTSLMILFIIFAVFAILTGGKSIYNMLWHDHANFFSDYFDSVQYASDDPYTKWGVIYPGFAMSFYQIIGHFTIPFADVNNPIYQMAGEMYVALALRNSQMGIMSYLMIVLVTFFVLNWTVKKITDRKDIRVGILFFLVFIASFPFIYAVERGNSILIVVPLCLIFLMGYRSEKKWVRYASYISLGCAVGFKIYPVIFALLIIRERRWKEAPICIIICIVVALAPLLFAGGNPMELLQNINNFATGTAGTRIGLYNIMDFISFLFEDTHLSNRATSLLSYVLMATMLLISVIVILFDRDMKLWKVIAIISCNLIVGPGVGSPYILVYVSIPLIFFLASEREATIQNILFVICFVAVMAVFPGFETANDMYMFIMDTTKTVFVFVMIVILLSEGIGHLYRKQKTEHDRTFHLSSA